MIWWLFLLSLSSILSPRPLQSKTKKPKKQSKQRKCFIYSAATSDEQNQSSLSENCVKFKQRHAYVSSYFGESLQLKLSDMIIISMGVTQFIAVKIPGRRFRLYKFLTESFICTLLRRMASSQSNWSVSYYIGFPIRQKLFGMATKQMFCFVLDDENKYILNT